MSDILDLGLFKWEGYDDFTVRDACQGVLVTGGIGSGKTSATGQLLASNYLEKGFCGTILTAKTDEKERWINYCKKYRRLDDLIILSPESGHRFNFMEYEIKRSDKGKGIVHNVADLLLKVIKSGYPDGNGNDQAFWDSSLENLVVNAVDLAMLTGNKRLEHIHDIVLSAPQTKKESEDPQFRKKSACMLALYHATSQTNAMPESIEKQILSRRCKNLEDYFLQTWINLAEKTRSIIEQMLSSFGSRFMREPLYSLFNTTTTISPDDVLKGKIILIDMPYLTFDRIGRDAQILWKYIFQRAMQRRTITPNSPPIFLWVDECQYFLNPKEDALFQSICRDKRVCSVYITQNLPNFYVHASGVGERGETLFKALAGNLSTKFFHANADVDTNEYAADLIGKDYLQTKNTSVGRGDSLVINQGKSETLAHIVQPSEFSKLMTGGPLNNFEAQAYVHRQGKTFQSTKSNYKLFHLNQLL
ncbi:MAG: hypothetical protein CML04_01985 [Pseudozobellia sp.]|nr:hypothetical protein [Pseudozobellia sp.]MBG48952.1 hypothetical protein [Pseudozobellia sp.]|tara:strand:- start:331694 stop:333118 length:1425 start_codon:yes stop_codon:yes gene_type:complete